MFLYKYMGVPGVPLKITREQIGEAIRKYNGIMQDVAKHFGISHNALYRHFRKYPELKPILDEEREAIRETDLDSAEKALRHAMTNCLESDLTNALKASMFFLNNRGKDRGYSNLYQQAKEGHKEALLAVKEMTEVLRSTGLKNIDDES